MASWKNPLQERLREIADDLAATVLDAIRDLSLQELIDLTGGLPDAPRIIETQPAPAPAGRHVRPKAPSAKPRRTRSMPPMAPAASADMVSPLPAPERKPLAQVRRTLHRRDSHAQEALRNALLACVARNPGVDAKLVSQKVGIPYGTAQNHLDDLVLSGALRMSSGQHGRCYSPPPSE